MLDLTNGGKHDLTHSRKTVTPLSWRELAYDLVRSSKTGEGVRDYVNLGRHRLMKAHQLGAPGSEVVQAHGKMIDLLLQRLFELAEDEYLTRHSTDKGPCAVVAQGGYGRGELNPYSDIDILFLYRWRATPYAAAVAEKILYPLWDAGLTVGHATRTLTECIRRARVDHVIQTALVDARHVSGDERLYADLQRLVWRQLGGRAQDRFVETKLSEYRQRHQRHGESVFLLEPDIKEGQGGLRDIHTAMWIARAKNGSVKLDDLPKTGLLDSRDVVALERGRDFLWRTRNELHFLAGRHQDRLTFGSQEQAAHGLGYDAEGRLSEVETFMRAYYLHAEEVSRLSSLIIHRLVHHSPSQHDEPRSGRNLSPGVRIAGGTLAVSRSKGDDGSPEELLDLFGQLQRHRLSLGQDSREIVRDWVSTMGQALPGSVGANRGFLDILRGNDWTYETLLEMHRADVLDSLIPEFGKVRCMALHDLYHIYTVDQHLMRAVKEFERLRLGVFEESLPRLSQLAREVEHPEILILGILFHDIGKGQGGNHSELGRVMCLQVAKRMGLNESEQALLSFLVLHHLLLTATAFRRDIQDEKTVIDLADTMGTARNLKALYLLTYSDVKAVGPDVWNNWKAALLDELFGRTLDVLEKREQGASGRLDRVLRVQRIQARLMAQLGPEHPVEEVRKEFLEAMPDRYFLATPEKDMPLHFRLLRRIGNEPFLAAVTHRPEHAHSEVTVCAHDQPGLFASIAGVFAAMELNVLSARINTRRDGLILDVFRISHHGWPEVVMDPGKWSRMESCLERVLRGDTDVAELVSRTRPRLAQLSSVRLSTNVRWDNTGSDDFTIIEVYTQDCPGVLFNITYLFSKLDVCIHLAKISTDVDRVADVFYVTDTGGRKIYDETRLAVLYEALRGELDLKDG